MIIMEKTLDRTTEWFVPAWGPRKFRVLVGLLFLPYTGMVLSFTVIGAMLADIVHWDRVAAMLVVYFLGLGIAAHALDALGSRKVKPWGEHLTRRQLWGMAIVSLIGAYAILIYHSVRHVPLLWAIAVLEGFFAFAYNLEWWDGRFHTDGWFVFSWGMLPTLGGYIMQTDSISIAAMTASVATGLVSYVEIKASRPYKELRRRYRQTSDAPPSSVHKMQNYELVLKIVSLGTILAGIGLAVYRLAR